MHTHFHKYEPEFRFQELLTIINIFTLEMKHIFNDCQIGNGRHGHRNIGKNASKFVLAFKAIQE
jgi:hypothetical protein